MFVAVVHAFIVTWIDRQEAAHLSLLDPLQHAFERLFSYKEDIVKSLRNNTIGAFKSLLGAKRKPGGSCNQQILAFLCTTPGSSKFPALEELHLTLKSAKALGLTEIPQVIDILLKLSCSSWEMQGKIAYYNQH